jgi:myosin heavy subunit
VPQDSLVRQASAKLSDGAASPVAASPASSAVPRRLPGTAAPPSGSSAKAVTDASASPTSASGSAPPAAAGSKSLAPSTPVTSDSVNTTKLRFFVGMRVLFSRNATDAPPEKGSEASANAVSLVQRSYEEGVVTNTSVQGQLTVEAASDGEVFSAVSDLAVFPFNYTGGPLATCHDLSHLPDSHDVGVLFAVQQRFKSDANYSFVGPMLLALNPYRFRNYPPDAPHPRTIAADAWEAVTGEAAVDVGKRKGGPLVAVVVLTGQSGSGKTESAKIVIREIARKSLMSIPSADGAGTPVQSEDFLKVLDAANPILESFGNAATRLSDNSSRFVKLVTLNVSTNSSSSTSTLASIAVEGMLLETSRVVSHAHGEGTFHIFNALFASYQGLTVEERTELGVWDPALFRCMLSSSNASAIASGSGAEGSSAAAISPASPFPSQQVSLSPAPFSLQVVREALLAVGLQAAEVWQVLSALAGILHLLNVEFSAEDAFAPAKVVTTSSLEKAAALLGFQDSGGLEGGSPSALLGKALTTVMLGANVRQLHKGAAIATRDTLAKALYEFVFTFCIAKINARLKGTGSEAITTTSGSGPTPRAIVSTSTAQVSILDIFGFEAVPVGSGSVGGPINDLEQLLINYTNELVQSIYDETVFGQFQNEAEREGVAAAVAAGSDASALEPPSSACLDVLSKKPNGVLHTISDESTLGQQQAATSQLTEKILALQRVFPDVIKRNKTKPNVFLLQHYCEQVEYCTDYMTRKNRISSGIAGLCRSSTNTCLRDAYAMYQSSALVATRNISSQIVLFREQMDRLAAILRSATSLHWIRCIKPNNERSATLVDPSFVLAQLNSSGVSKTLSLLANGYSVRMPHDAFVLKYLAPALRSHFRALRSAPKKEESFAAVEELLRAAKFRDVCVLASKLLPCCQNKKLVVGATKAFLRSRTLQELQTVTQALVVSTAGVVQRFGRGLLARMMLVPRRMQLLEDRRLAAVKARIERELPERQALEEQRIALHRTSAEARSANVRGLHARLQRQSSLVLQKVKLATDIISSELQRACNEVMAFDSVREKKEAELREVAEFNAHYAELAEKALENARLQAQAKEAARKRELELERAKADSARNKGKILGHDREEQMRQAVLSAQAAQVRATVRAEAEQLAQKAAAAEAAERRRLREHLAKQQHRIAERAAIQSDQLRQEEYVNYRIHSLHARVASSRGTSPSPLPKAAQLRAPSFGPSPQRRLSVRAPSPSRGDAHSGDERLWAMQRDMWQVWERANGALSSPLPASRHSFAALSRVTAASGTPRR